MFQDLEERYYIGIDPGNSGAWAVINAKGRLLHVADMPLTQDTEKKQKIDAQYLYQTMSDYCDDLTPTKVILERVQAMPGGGTASGMPSQGIASTFTFGKAAGLIEATAIIAFGEDNLSKVTPQAWKKRFDLTKGSKKLAVAALHGRSDAQGERNFSATKKLASVLEARALFPEWEKVFIVSKDGRAEATLMAYLLYIDSQGKKV